MTENDWNEKYPGLFLSKTDYHYYKKLGKSKYNIERMMNQPILEDFINYFSK
jgi:hypothetical protein